MDSRSMSCKSSEIMQATSGTMCYAGKCYVSSTVSFILDTYIDKPLKKERNEKVALKTDKKNI